MSDYSKAKQEYDALVWQERNTTSRVGYSGFPSTGIKRYSTTPEVVEAVMITESNEKQVALWCGGALGADQASDGVYDFVRVPTLSGILKANRGNYVVKNINNGQFTVLTEAQFKDKGYHEVGLRQDGPQIRTTGTITKDPGPPLINSGEAYGPYADHRYFDAQLDRLRHAGPPRDVLDMS